MNYSFSGIAVTALKAAVVVAFFATFAFVINDFALEDRGPNLLGSFSELSKAMLILALFLIALFLMSKTTDRSIDFLKRTLSPRAYRMLTWGQLLIGGFFVISFFIAILISS